MDKNEILQKAQNSDKPDEMELYIIQRGQSISMLIMSIVAIILMIIKVIQDQSWYDVFCIIFAGMSIVHLYKYFKLRINRSLIIGLITTVAAIVTFVYALIDLLG